MHGVGARFWRLGGRYMQQDHGKRLDDALFYEIPELHNCQLQERLWRPAMTDTIGCLGWQALEG